MKSLKFILIFILAVVIIGIFGYTQVTKKKSTPLTSESTQKIDSYGFNGKVLTLGSNNITVKGIIVRKVGEETKAVPESRTFTTSSSTKYVKTTNQGNQNLKFTDIKVGDNVNVITKQNFFNQDNLPADEIDIVAY